MVTNPNFEHVLYNVKMGTNLKNSLIKKGFFQAFGIALYCSLVGLIFWKADEIFGQMNNFTGPITFLLMFSVSALICAIIVFYQPYKLFFDGKRKEAASLVLYTTGFIFGFFLLFMFINVVL
jgi:hypothetical protein